MLTGVLADSMRGQEPAIPALVRVIPSVDIWNGGNGARYERIDTKQRRRRTDLVADDPC